MSGKNVLGDVADTLHVPELVPPEQVDVHVDALLERRDFGIQPPDTKECLDVAVAQHCREALTQRREARDSAAHLHTLCQL